MLEPSNHHLMNMFFIRVFTITFFICSSNILFPQEEFTVFNESSLSFNHKPSKGYTINFSFKGRNYLYNENNAFVKQRHLELGHFSTFSITPKTSLSLGIMYRNRDWFENSENEIRTTLQYNIKSIIYHFRFGHRLRAEQRFYETSTAFRFRYRLAFDIPLNGEKLNIGETYFVGTSEILWTTLRESKPIFDNRWSAQIGWLISTQTKLQTGLEYRFDRLNVGSQQMLFLLTTAVFNL